MTATSDVLDEHRDRAAVCQVAFRRFGRLRAFEGPISTIRCDEDNVLVKRHLSEPGLGRVLVVDGGGSERVALVGEMVASLARDNGWAGLVINGCVRDVSALRDLDVGIKAIGSNPRPSGKAGLGEVDVPVTFGGVTFRPGDMLFSDDDGVVTLGPRA
ncbi:MAG: ribonuclease E activity regulator RraA [Actinomycetota bacterium]